MFFLLRTAFWLSIVLALLPSVQSKPVTNESTIGAFDAVAAAGAALSDATQFCDRQPEACVVGAQAAAAFGQRAQAGAKMVYEFINEKIAASDADAAPPVASSPATVVKSQNTLKSSDTEPAWRNPAEHKSAQTRKPAA